MDSFKNPKTQRKVKRETLRPPLCSDPIVNYFTPATRSFKAQWPSIAIVHQYPCLRRTFKYPMPFIPSNATIISLRILIQFLFFHFASSAHCPFNIFSHFIMSALGAFATLPLEIRLMIYKEANVSPKPVHICTGCKQAHTKGLSPGLLSTSRAIYYEARPYLYSKNTFVLTASKSEVP